MKTTGTRKTKKENDFFRSFADKLKDEDTNIAADGLGSAESASYIDTGCLGLNALCSGSLTLGIPDNKFLGLAGESTTGKTFFALGIVKNFMDQNPTGGCLYYDTESAVMKSMLEERGIDTSRFIIAEPATIEQFRTQCLNALTAYGEADNPPPMMMVLDSLGALSTTKETTDIGKGNDVKDMTRTQLVRGAFRVLRLKAAKVHVPMIITNHTYQGIGPYAPQMNISGGGGFKYAADIILTLQKKKDVVGKKTVGVIIRVKTFKSRISKENQQIELKLNYDTGLDKYYGLRELAELYGVLKFAPKKDGSGEDGKQYLIGGEKYWPKDVEADPSLLFRDPANLAALEAVVKREFCYGQVPVETEHVDPETGEVLEEPVPEEV